MVRDQILSLSLFALILLKGTTGLSSSVLQDTIKANGYYSTADSLYKSGQFDSAAFYYDKSALLFEAHNLLEKHFTSKIRIASTLRRQRKLDSAISYSKTVGEAIIRKMGPNSLLESKVLEVMGNCYNIKSEFDEALKCQLKVLEIRKQIDGLPRFHLADAYSNLAITYFRKGYYDQSLENFKSTLEMRKLEYGTDHLLVADAYHNLGFFYFTLGEQDLSLEHYMISLNIYKKLYGEEHYELGNVYNGMAQVLESKGQYEEAMKYLAKAYETGTSVFGKNHYLVTDALANMANVSFKKGEYTEALNFNLETLLSNRKQFGEDNIATSHSYLQIGKCHHQLGNQELAFDNFNKSKRILERIFKTRNPGLANIYNEMGSYYLDLDNLDSALFYFQKSMRYNVVDFEDSVLLSNPELEGYIDKNMLLKSLYNKAKALTGKYKINEELGYLTMAMKTFQLCDTLNDEIRHTQLLHSDKLALGKVSSKIFDKGIAVSKLLYELTGDTNYLTILFHFFEKSKSNILLESIAELKAKNYASIAPFFIKSTENLQQDISFLQSKVVREKTQKPDSKRIEALELTIFNLKREHETLIAKIEKEYPNYFNLKYKTATATITDIQNDVVQTNQTLVEYFVSDKVIYAMIIRKGEVKVQELTLDEALNESILTLPVYLKEEDLENYALIAHKLYNQLMAPLELEDEELIIVPDDILWHLNFDVLLTNSAPKLDFRTLDYVIKKHRISYAYSGTLLLEDLERKRPEATSNECLAFSYDSPMDTLNGDFLAINTMRSEERVGLPGTHQEVKTISDVLEGDYFFGSLANEKNFKRYARDYRILHLAVHGTVDDQHPMNSKLIFSQVKDSIEDNYLHAFELYNTTLNADLAVLSACNTGAGKVEKGEGIMSLGRAFSYAGCKSLLISQWELSDATTPMIIGDFYQNLHNGQGKSGSLRNAKLAYLQSADNPSANPFYWASLVQIGNDAPIYTSGQRTWIWALLFVLFFLIVYAGYRRNRVVVKAVE